jgi:exodeoxyribonuclease V beta subunit
MTLNTMPEKLDSFDPIKVKLEKRNLIQASAGTGKTYSLAFLAVRLVVEKNLPINQILLVTFTNSAVAELEIRVRDFVRQALKCARGEAIEDQTIDQLIKGYLGGMDPETVVKRLNDAQLLLDETSVMTIHGFCQQVLKEYAFETGQIFGSETMSPDELNELTRDGVYEFWRSHVTVLDPILLERLLGVQSGKKILLSTEHLLNVVKAGIGGKKPRSGADMPADFLAPQGQANFMRSIEVIRQGKEQVRLDLISRLQDPELHAAIARNGHAKKAYQKFIDAGDWEGMLDTLQMALKKSPLSAYIPIVFESSLLEDVRGLAQNDLESIAYRRYVAWITEAAYDQVNAGLRNTLNERGLITFDEMIRLTYQALQGPGRDKLVAAMRQKYKAVFCDEYQDTDRYQHEIFKALFYDDTVLFFVGDSKQSIYAFRKADLNTFFDAEQTVDRVHQMDINRRSTDAFIQAMNRFFLPREDFPTFAFDRDGPSIKYTLVKSPDENKRGQMTFKGQPVVPMLISRHANKKQMPGAVLNTILNLIQGEFSIGGRKTEFSDIGILVRTNKEGKKIQSYLSANRIPCISIDDTRIFGTQEAREIYLILLGIYERSRGGMNRALLTTIGGYDIERLKRADPEDLIKRFRTYHEVWHEEGVYVMLHKFFADHGLYGLRDSVKGGDRIITNALHLAELVHRARERKDFDMLELIQWMKKGMDGEIREGDEYLQRLESDEQAVKIVTMHKAKGLEYNIVICPYLDMNDDSSFYVTGSFRDLDGEYYVMDKKLMNEEELNLYLEQSEQENRRLLYVAITRARYQCYIMSSSFDKADDSTLRKFRDELDAISEDLDPSLIILDHMIPTGLPPYRPSSGQDDVRYETATNFQSNLREKDWRRTSYSGLTREHEAAPLKRYEGLSADPYDRFVFSELRRGAQTGNLLHYMFEKIDFSVDTHWDRVISRGLKRAGSSYDEGMMRQLIVHVLGADLGTGFCMQDIPNGDRLSELEFDFPLSPFMPSRIDGLSTQQVPLMTRSMKELEGMMNGKVDLVFRHGGRYWILDWKSNWLGEKPADYEGGNLSAAMADNNYHLQYHIYTLALKKFLTLNHPGFDYERDFGGCIYLFMRGARAGAPQGLFSHKPDIQLIRALEDLFSGQ